MSILDMSILAPSPLRLAIAAGSMLMLASCTSPRTQSADALWRESFKQITVVLVGADRLPKPVGLYKGDGDPLTLEIVELTEKSDGPSRITPDAEVVFLYRASDSQRIKLFQQAMNSKVARNMAGI